MRSVVLEDLINTVKISVSTLTSRVLIRAFCFAENDVKARDYVMSLMVEAGLHVSSDSMGSIFGTWMEKESDTTLGPVATGSHCDAIPLAGAYDGTVGVLGAIEAVRSLRRSGFRPKIPIQVIMFSSEEPTRFGISCVSSRAMAGVLKPADLAKLRDENGTTFLDAARKAGYAKDIRNEEEALRLAAATKYHSFIELHIEQGPELEQSGVDIGAVTAIAAPAALRVIFKGSGGHAGALLMKNRNDAGLAASELALEVEKAVLGTNSIDTVGTVGKWSMAPNAINSVPRMAELEIDIRDIDLKRRDSVLSSIVASIERIAKERAVEYVVEVLNADPPASASKDIVNIIEEASSHFKLSSRRMVSRAYHDALFMGQVTNMGMIFIPCEGGKSHRPDEYVTVRDMTHGIEVLAYTLAQLSGDLQNTKNLRSEL